MSYKIRNIIVLIVFNMLIVLLGGFLTLWSYPRKLEEVRKEVRQVNQQIRQLEGIESEYYLLDDIIKQKEAKLASIDKILRSRITPNLTYKYLNRIVNRVGFIAFDMLYLRSEAREKFGYNVYRIKGEGSYERIVKLIWFLERGPYVYVIDKLNLHGLESRDPDSFAFRLIITFEMEVRAYYADVQDFPEVQRSLADVVPPKTRNPFYPHVLRDIPPNTENLVEVERAELKAVIKGKALISDANGNTQMLSVGDKVYLGYLEKVDPNRNMAVFSLNKGGIYEKVVLKLRFEE